MNLQSAALDAVKVAAPQLVSPTIFVLYAGIGDQVAWLGHLSGAKSDTPIVVVVDERSEALARMYPGAYSKLVVIPRQADNSYWMNEPGQPMLAWHHAFGDHETEAVEKDQVFVDVIRKLLGCSSEFIAHSPVSSDEAKAKAFERFAELGYPQGKTVLISTLSRTMRVQPSYEWFMGLVKHIRDQGLHPVINGSAKARGFDLPDDAVIPGLEGVRAVSLPLDVLLPFSELCGRFIGLRSGLGDLLAYSSCKVTALYPLGQGRVNEPDGFWSIRRNHGNESVREVTVGPSEQFEAGKFPF